ncbi:hypothetical protein B0T24DRAFT_522841 [Lasiosphaeria ovina]|uniref:Uncharacterized protein n=1 Tax=Lasiosphaeria ovina TaxID=92902 RepID=A0AAE0KM79_9PEZI|nr:hypothetical protein B0T24DRAFT_522841 [Lasiosphaeria ovina]
MSSKHDQPVGPVDPPQGLPAQSFKAFDVWGPLIGGSREAWRDLRAFKLHRAGWLLFFLWICLLVGLLALLSPLGSLNKFALAPIAPCQLDGTFDIDPNSYNWWSPSQVFQIALGSGSLTFGQAKVVDVVWDISVGRLGQAIMAYFSWRVFADYVTTSIVDSPITYATFWIIYLYREPSLTSCFRLIRDFWRGHVLDSKCAMVFMLLTMFFLLSFPTLASAMTGYVMANRAYIRSTDLSLIRFPDLMPTAYLIHDGSRINLTDDYPIFYFEPTDVSEYGFYGLKNISTRWMNGMLNPPALNISAFYFNFNESRLSGFNWKDPRTGNFPFRDLANRAYSDKHGHTFSLDYIAANGSCQPVSDACNAIDGGSPADMDVCRIQNYVWGFSFIQLYINILLLLVWSVGIFILWVKAQRHLPLPGEIEVPQGWKALIELSSTMKQELDSKNINPKNLTDKQLKDKIRKSLRDGSVSLQYPLQRHNHKIGRRFGEFFASNAWWFVSWLAAISLTTIVISHSPIMLRTVWCTLGALAFGIFWAIVVGTTRRSKAAIAIFWALVGLCIGLTLQVCYGGTGT